MKLSKKVQPKGTGNLITQRELVKMDNKQHQQGPPIAILVPDTHSSGGQVPMNDDAFLYQHCHQPDSLSMNPSNSYFYSQGINASSHQPSQSHNSDDFWKLQQAQLLEQSQIYQSRNNLESRPEPQAQVSYLSAGVHFNSMYYQFGHLN